MLLLWYYTPTNANRRLSLFVSVVSLSPSCQPSPSRSLFVSVTSLSPSCQPSPSRSLFVSVTSLSPSCQPSPGRSLFVSVTSLSPSCQPSPSRSLFVSVTSLSPSCQPSPSRSLFVSVTSLSPSCQPSPSRRHSTLDVRVKYVSLSLTQQIRWFDALSVNCSPIESSIAVVYSQSVCSPRHIHKNFSVGAIHVGTLDAGLAAPVRKVHESGIGIGMVIFMDKWGFYALFVCLFISLSLLSEHYAVEW